MPFPLDKGLSLAPGYAMSVGMRKVSSVEHLWKFLNRTCDQKHHNTIQPEREENFFSKWFISKFFPIFWQITPQYLQHHHRHFICLASCLFVSLFFLFYLSHCRQPWIFGCCNQMMFLIKLPLTNRNARDKSGQSDIMESFFPLRIDRHIECLYFSFKVVVKRSDPFRNSSCMKNSAPDSMNLFKDTMKADYSTAVCVTEYLNFFLLCLSFYMGLVLLFCYLKYFNSNPWVFVGYEVVNIQQACADSELKV